MKKLTSPEEIQDLLEVATRSAALGAAVETGLLWRLAEKPQSGVSIARALHIPVRRCQYWLQLLEETGILKKTALKYELSDAARQAFLNAFSQDTWVYLASEARERSAGVHNLSLCLGEPGSVWEAQGLSRPISYVEKMRTDAKRARDFTRMLYDLHQNLADELAARLDMTGVSRLLDVGGGSGVVSLALLRRYPDLTAVVTDIEYVCLAGREIAAEKELSGRIVYQPIDFEREPFSSGFDSVLLCDVEIFGEPFFRKLWAALNQGGRLVIVSDFPASEDVAPKSRIEWTLIDSLENPDFALPTLAHTRQQLRQAGFHPLPGEEKLPDQRLIVQAQK